MRSQFAQLAKDLGVSEATLYTWLKQADLDKGRSEGLTTTNASSASAAGQPGAGLAPTCIDTAAGQSFFRVGVANVSVPTAAGGDHISIAGVHQLQPNRTVLAEVFVAQDTVFNVCTVYAHVVQN